MVLKVVESGGQWSKVVDKFTTLWKSNNEWTTYYCNRMPG